MKTCQKEREKKKTFVIGQKWWLNWPLVAIKAGISAKLWSNLLNRFVKSESITSIIIRIMSWSIVNNYRKSHTVELFISFDWFSLLSDDQIISQSIWSSFPYSVFEHSGEVTGNKWKKKSKSNTKRYQSNCTDWFFSPSRIRIGHNIDFFFIASTFIESLIRINLKIQTWWPCFVRLVSNVSYVSYPIPMVYCYMCTVCRAQKKERPKNSNNRTQHHQLGFNIFYKYWLSHQIWRGIISCSIISITSIWLALGGTHHTRNIVRCRICV